MPAPPIAGAASPQTAMTDAMSGGLQQPGAAQDQQRQGLETLMGQVRDIGQQVQQIGVDFPNLAPDVEQVMTKLKEIVVKAASQAPQQTASGAAVPV